MFEHPSEYMSTVILRDFAIKERRMKETVE